MKIGIIASAFDLLHPGHLILLKDSKEKCDHLIVALHTNPQIERNQKNKPLQTTFERFVQLESCKYVDEIIPYDTENDLKNILLTRKIDIRFLGSEYEFRDFTGKEIESIELSYHRREHTFSSSELRERL